MGENIHFINNRGKTLFETIKNLSSSTENIYILVGFFYFSGFFRLKDEFKDKKIKILVGLDIQKHLSNFLIEYEIFKTDNNTESIAEIKNRFYNSIVKSFSHSDLFDNSEIKNSFKIFIEKVEDGSIEVRKTFEPNHAKLYIFENKKEYSQNGDYPGTVITGSSNLSIDGLEKRFEIDVISRDKAHYLEAKKIFDELWEKSIPVITKETQNEFKEKVLNKIWPTYELPTPYEVYIRILSEYFSVNKTQIRIPKDINPDNYINLEYQNDAVRFGVETLRKHNGVIIADVVGLGKSIIASAIANNINLDTIIITPPHLIDQWKDYKRKSKIYGDVYSIGKIEQAIKDYSETDRKKLIIVDEAHRFRNTETLNYKNLWLLCQGNYVVLLTATPFNNTPQDIEALIKLFNSPKKSTLRHIDNLSEEFKSLIKKYKDLKETSKTAKRDHVKQQADEIAKRIRYIISPITIRRTRVDLLKIKKYRDDLEKQGIVFPKVNPPDIVSYSFGKFDDLYIETIERFIDSDGLRFKAARYKPISYIEDEDYKADIAIKYTGQKTKKEALAFIEQSQTNLSSLIKRIFVKRFESSFGSFKNSIEDYINSHKKIQEFYKNGRIPIYKKINEIPSLSEINDMDPQEREEIETKLKNLENESELIWIDSNKISNNFIKDLQNDIKVLQDIKQKWFGVREIPDYKLQKLIEILNNKIKNNEKVIIFSEYADTVSYLYENLIKEGFKSVRYSSSDGDDLKEEIKKNFDASYKNQKNDYDILITTDILSEGINLHRANNIINYDIPYNPTRVIQRIGRVNRISKIKLKDIFIYNFFPTSIGEQHTNIKNISTLKMYMIHFLLGEDAQYLTTDEEIKNFFYEEFKNSSYFEEESWDVKYRNFLYDVQERNPELYNKSLTIPYRTKIKRVLSSNFKIEGENIKDTFYITFAKKGVNFIFKAGINLNNEFKIKTLNDEDAIEIFKANKDEKSYDVTDRFYEKYNEIKKNIFKTSTLVLSDRWEREVYNKIRIIEEKIKDSQYYSYVSKLKKLLDLEVLPEYIIKIIKQIKHESIEDIELLKKELPEIYIDETIRRMSEYDKEDDVIIISEEIDINK